MNLIGQDSVWDEFLTHLHSPTHLFLTGPAGCGKTTMVRTFLQHYATERGRPYPYRWGHQSTEDCLLLGPEQDRGIQTIRGQVSLFIRQMAAEPNIYRWVVIDDVDSLPHISQQALRRPMESYSHITRFLFIGTSEEDLIPAMRSRCIHLKMNTVDILQERPSLLNFIGIPPKALTEEMWSWIISLSSGNLSDLLRLLRLLRDVHRFQQKPLTLPLVRSLCSAPFYLHFLPLMTAMYQRDVPGAIRHLIHIWKRGYMYEDILESFQQIHQMFGDADLENNVLIHQFLIQAWVSYCKGNTSLLSLQHTVYRVLSSPSSASLMPSGLTASLMPSIPSGLTIPLKSSDSITMRPPASPPTKPGVSI